MVYAVNIVCVDSQGIRFETDIEKAKGIWASMYIEVFEVTEEQKAYLLATFNREQINEVVAYIKEHCTEVFNNRNSG